MFRNYLKIVIRNFKSRKLYALINILGLVFGLTACMFIWRYVVFELSYDRFHSKADDIYRVTLAMYDNNALVTHTAENYLHTGPELKETYPEIMDYTRLSSMRGLSTARYGDDIYAEEENIYYTENSLFRVFDIKFLQGDPNTALTKPRTAVISESAAKKYFKNEDPMGKSLFLTTPAFPESDFMIVGVCKDMPKNSHLQFDILMSNYNFIRQERFQQGWDWWIFYTYIVLKPGSDAKALEAKLPQFINANVLESYKRNEGTNSSLKFTLQPLTSIHMYSDLKYELFKHDGGNGRYVWILLVLSVFVIVIAWVNFINLSTARAIDRAKEVGVRKVLGASRLQLIKQFLMEAGIINLVAAIISIGLFYLFLSRFGDFTSRSLFNVGRDFELLFWVALLIALIIGAILSGIYPALVLSSFKPDLVMKGKAKSSGSANLLRKGLVVFQFTISIILLIWTFATFKQVEYMQQRDLGMDIEQTLVVRGPVDYRGNIGERVRSFKTDMKKQAAVFDISHVSNIPGADRIGATHNGCNFQSEDGTPVVLNDLFYTSLVDYNFLGMMGTKMVAGRNFSEGRGEDRDSSTVCIINETMAKKMGFSSPEKALNKIITVGWWENIKVVGVVKDFNLQALKYTVGNYVFIPSQQDYSYFVMKIRTDNMQSAVASVKNTWHSIFKNDPFLYFFLDEYFNQQYQSDVQFGRAFGLAAFLAIIVACMGLFGFSSYLIIQRTKEISIRKVLGASLTSIQYMLMNYFAKLVLLAIIISMPVMYFIIDKWLQNYPFRIQTYWWLFVIPCVAVLLVSLVVISYQTLKASLTPPATALRQE